jgi:hypothetical protein
MRAKLLKQIKGTPASGQFRYGALLIIQVSECPSPGRTGLAAGGKLNQVFVSELMSLFPCLLALFPETLNAEQAFFDYALLPDGHVGVVLLLKRRRPIAVSPVK